jgi:zinc/manganese transport system substrate-binding protein
MNKFLRLTLSTGLLMLGALPAVAVLRIVATTPDLADVTRRIGGDLVKVESLAKGTEDIHAVPQRPSFVPKLNQADGVVLLGLEAEHAFLPALLDVAQNPHILRGRPGYIDCAEDIVPLEVPTVISRSEGEQHPMGNPHYNTDPRKGFMIADAIARGLSRLDPKNEAVYAENRDRFKKELTSKIDEWGRLIAPLRGQKAVSYHPDMVYLAEYVGLDMVGTIELKAGIPPTPRHLEELVRKMRDEKASLILREIQYSDDTSRWLADQTGAKAASVATMGGAFPDSQTYFGMIEHNLRAILEASL